MMYAKTCEKCGRRLTPCPSKLRADGEQTFVGFYRCECDEARLEDTERTREAA